MPEHGGRSSESNPIERGRRFRPRSVVMQRQQPSVQQSNRELAARRQPPVQRSAEPVSLQTSLKAPVETSVIKQDIVKHVKKREHHNAQPKALPPRTKRSVVLRRQMVERAKERKIVAAKKRASHALLYTFVAIIIFLALLVLWSFRDALPFKIGSSNERPKVINSVEPKSNDGSTLDETEPTAEEITANMVAVGTPKTLKIPAISLTARVRLVATSLNGEPIAPKNIYDIGWYEGSSRPNTEGAVLLNGHLAGPNRSGSFKELKTLQVGDEILLELGGGTELRYKVARLQEYAGGQVDMKAAVQSVDTTKKGLNLMTTLNKYSGGDTRLIVFAVQQ